MLTIPKDPKDAYNLFRAFHHLKMDEVVSPVMGFLMENLSGLDEDNRTELNVEVFRMRQGAAQAISQTLSFINQARDQMVKLESLIRSPNGGKHENTF